MPTPSGRISRTASNTMQGTPIWWSVSAVASPPMPPPAMITGLFVNARSDPQPCEFQYPLDGGWSQGQCAAGRHEPLVKRAPPGQKAVCGHEAAMAIHGGSTMRAFPRTSLKAAVVALSLMGLVSMTLDDSASAQSAASPSPHPPACRSSTPRPAPARRRAAARPPSCITPAGSTSTAPRARNSTPRSIAASRSSFRSARAA